MSTVVVATVKSNTSSPPAFQNTSGTEIGTLCRAWVNFNGTGTVAIQADFNVSSITDNGNGDYTVNFTTAMADANYACVLGCNQALTQMGDNIYSVGNFATSSVRIYSNNQVGGLSPEDSAIMTAAIFR